MERSAKNNIKQIKEKIVIEKSNLKILQNKTHENVMGRYGSIENFVNTLSLSILNKHDDDRLEKVYDFYTEFFPLENERESLDGFKTALKLNSNKKYQKFLSPFEESWFLLSDSDGSLIAGVNFTLYTFPETTANKLQTNGSGNLIYIFVKKEYRTMGIAGYLLKKTEEYIKNKILNSGPYKNEKKVLITCEINAPELMTKEDYFTDSLLSATDPCDRVIWWDGKGYKRLMFNYAQPALEESSSPCVSITLNMKTNEEFCIVSGELLYEHLRRYFETSVFKGKCPVNNEYIEELKKYLLDNPTIKTTGNKEYYLKLKDKHHKLEYEYSAESLFRQPLIKK